MQVLLNKNTKRSKMIGIPNVAHLAVLDFLDVSQGGLGTTAMETTNAALICTSNAVQAQSSIGFDGTVFAAHGNAIVSNSASGCVGIRTNEPGSRLTVEGDAAFGNLEVLDRTLRCSSAFVTERPGSRGRSWTSDLSEPRLAQSALGSGYVAAIGTDHDVVLMIPKTLPGNIGVYDVHRKVFRSPVFVDQPDGPVAGACLLKNDKVLLTTRTARFYIVNLADGTSTEASVSPTVAAIQGQADAYLSSGAMLADGRILFAPGTAPKACAYDPATSIVDLVGPAFSEDVSFTKFASAISMPDGRVCYVPYDSDRMVLYDPMNNVIAVDVPFPLDRPDINPRAKFSGGLLGPDGATVLFLPRDMFYVLALNPATLANTKIPIMQSPGIANGFSGGLLAPDGKVVLVPREAKNIVVLDLDKRTRIEIPGGGYGGHAQASNSIVLAPQTATHVGLLGPYLL